MGILKGFYPDYMYKSVEDIEENFFKKRDIKYALLDIDNTLVPYTVAKPTASAKAFLHRLEQEGVTYCFLSNNNAKRVELFNEEIKAECVSNAKKPLLYGLKKAMARLGAQPQNTVLIGDQIFTDVRTGKRAGIKTVLVEPIEDKETAFFKFKRAMESIVLKDYRRGH